MSDTPAAAPTAPALETTPAAAPTAQAAKARTVADWAIAKGEIVGADPKSVGRMITRPPWLHDAAKQAQRWDDGTMLTEAEYDAGLAAAGGLKLGHQHRETEQAARAAKTQAKS